MSVIVSNYCFVFEKFGCCVSDLVFGLSSQVNILIYSPLNKEQKSGSHVAISYYLEFLFCGTSYW